MLKEIQIYFKMEGNDLAGIKNLWKSVQSASSVFYCFLIIAYRGFGTGADLTDDTDLHW